MLGRDRETSPNSIDWGTRLETVIIASSSRKMARMIRNQCSPDSVVVSALRVYDVDTLAVRVSLAIPKVLSSHGLPYLVANSSRGKPRHASR